MIFDSELRQTDILTSETQVEHYSVPCNFVFILPSVAFIFFSNKVCKALVHIYLFITLTVISSTTVILNRNLLMFGKYISDIKRIRIFVLVFIIFMTDNLDMELTRYRSPTCFATFQLISKIHELIILCGF